MVSPETCTFGVSNTLIQLLQNGILYNCTRMIVIITMKFGDGALGSFTHA